MQILKGRAVRDGGGEWLADGEPRPGSPRRVLRGSGASAGRHRQCAGGARLYPAREGVALDHGHTVPAREPLWPGAQMRSFLVVRPRPNFLPALELQGGSHVEFFQAIPLFDAEVAFKRKYGAEALLRRWEEADVHFWDSERVLESPRER
jgi:hypothetical protein